MRNARMVEATRMPIRDGHPDAQQLKPVLMRDGDETRLPAASAICEGDGPSNAREAASPSTLPQSVSDRMIEDRRRGIEIVGDQPGFWPD
jgi:hypothetical protein